MSKTGIVIFAFCSISLNVFASGMPSGGKGFGGVIKTDDPFSKCPGSNEFVSFNGEGGGVFLNDIATGKVKKIQKGISLKTLTPQIDGTTRVMFEVKQPSFPTGFYVFTKDAQGNVIKVELSNSKKDKDIENEAEMLLSRAIDEQSSSIKIPTHRAYDFNHTADGCEVSNIELTSRVFQIKNGKLDSKETVATQEREYDEKMCDSFNRAKNDNPELIKKIRECSFLGSDLFKSANGLLEKLRKEHSYGEAPPWTPNTNLPHDLISNVRLGSRSINDIVAVPAFSNPSTILKSISELNTLCDEKYSMWHSGNIEVRKKREARIEKKSIETEDSNSIRK